MTDCAMYLHAKPHNDDVKLLAGLAALLKGAESQVQCASLNHTCRRPWGNPLGAKYFAVSQAFISTKTWMLESVGKHTRSALPVDKPTTEKQEPCPFKGEMKMCH